MFIYSNESDQAFQKLQISSS